MPEAAQWYVQLDGRLQGPFTVAQLAGLSNAGRLMPTSYVCREGQQWQTAATVPGLFAARPEPGAVRDAIPVVRPTVSSPSAPARRPAPPRAQTRPQRSRVEDDDEDDEPKLRKSSAPLLLILGGSLLLLVVLCGGGAFGIYVVTSDFLGKEGLADGGLDPLADGGGFTAPPSEAPPPRPSGKRMSVEELVATCGPSVCIVSGRLGHGSGFVVAPGVIATNYHVVEPNQRGGLTVRFPSARGEPRGGRQARYIHGNKNRDLAFLAYDGKHPPLPLAADYRFRSGQEIIIIGSPGVGNVEMIQNAVTRGLMSTMLNEGDLTLFQLDASVNPGNSGGPVFDESGNVVGVVTAKAKREERLSFCVSVNTLRDELRRAGVNVR